MGGGSVGKERRASEPRRIGPEGRPENLVGLWCRVSGRGNRTDGLRRNLGGDVGRHGRTVRGLRAGRFVGGGSVVLFLLFFLCAESKGFKYERGLCDEMLLFSCEG